MEDIVVRGWDELHGQLYEGSWNTALSRFRSRFAFRGMSDARQDLTTSLQRLGGPYHQMERHLLRDFRKYAPGETGAGLADSVWLWLALAQHHGLPTRLLDWSYSPYAAMHFATEDTRLFDRDGVIWLVDRAPMADHLPDTMKRIMEEEDSGVFTADMLDRAAATLAEFDALCEEPFVAFFEPPSLDARIVNQFALFSLMSDPRARLDHWLAGHPDVARRIVIPAALKWEVRDKLDQANITERLLYPGLDGLARWLKRYYMPRDEGGA